MKQNNTFRKHKKNNFTVIDNGIFKNEKLSWKSKGLLTTLLSLPEDWEFTERGLQKLATDGRDGLRSALKELEEKGYLERTPIRNDQGHFISTQYNIYEESQTAEKPKSETPKSENPKSDKPKSDNTPNKELSNKELSNKELKELKELKDIVVSEKTEDDIPYQEILEYLNLKAEKKYVTNGKRSEASRRHIKARWNQGFKLEDFKNVIDIKCKEWKGDSFGDKFLRPETLFGTKFESYLNEKPIEKKIGYGQKIIKEMPTLAEMYGTEYVEANERNWRNKQRKDAGLPYDEE